MLSVVINVKNGEAYLDRCLAALSRFNDVVLLDNHSTDSTIAIAKTYPNVRIFECEFCGMGKVRNIASTYAQNDWIFCVDSDEIVNQKLVDKLLAMQFKDNCVYRVLRLNYYDNFLVNASAWENDWIYRIYNRKQTKFNEVEVHESLDLSKLATKKIKAGYLYHFPYENIAKLIEKMQFYSTLYAKQNVAKKKVYLAAVPLRTLLMFIKCYILKRGFLYGYEGLAISSFNAIGVFAKYIKLYELSYKRKIALAVGVIESIDELKVIIENVNQQILLPEEVIFLIDDKLFYAGKIVEIKQLLREKMVVPSKIIGEVDQDIRMVLNSYLIEKHTLNNVAYLDDSRLLGNKKLFHQVKHAILANSSVPNVEIYSN